MRYIKYSSLRSLGTVSAIALSFVGLIAYGAPISGQLIEPFISGEVLSAEKLNANFDLLNQQLANLQLEVEKLKNPKITIGSKTPDTWELSASGTTWADATMWSHVIHLAEPSIVIATIQGHVQGLSPGFISIALDNQVTPEMRNCSKADMVKCWGTAHFNFKATEAWTPIYHSVQFVASTGNHTISLKCIQRFDDICKIFGTTLSWIIVPSANAESIVSN